MPQSQAESYPYASLVAPLLVSIMRAQADILALGLNHFRQKSPRYGSINRHFSWLAFSTRAGENRHLIDGQDGMHPLSTQALRVRGSVPSELISVFANCGPVPLYEEEGPEQDFVQQSRTRIASLILRSLEASENVPRGASPQAVFLESPVSVLYDFLTVPELPGTRAYALVACRNLLFSVLKIRPALSGALNPGTFTIRDIELAVSHTWTSLRDRFHSRGKDPLRAGTIGSATTLVRHFLALKANLIFRFESEAQRLSYLKRASLVSPSGHEDLLTFFRSPQLERLPEVGELVNELWGLPIPLKGADTVFRGGLKFSARNGLIMAIHGGPGSGKTSLALALSAYLAPFGINTLFLTAEEIAADLRDRLSGLIPDTMRRLSFFPADIQSKIQIERYQVHGNGQIGALRMIQEVLGNLAAQLNAERESSPNTDSFQIDKPCKSIIVLDGLHDLFASLDGIFPGGDQDVGEPSLYSLLETLRELRAFVIITTGLAWSGESDLDYLVDVAVRLTYEATDNYGAKPDRRLLLTKARHQLCAAGTHGLQISGLQGVRFSPQISYQLERRAIWKSRLPNQQRVLTTLRRVAVLPQAKKKKGDRTREAEDNAAFAPENLEWKLSTHAVNMYEGSHVFINGQGSGGKAALALKIALSPRFSAGSSTEFDFLENREKILIVSFLYPQEYYNELQIRLTRLHKHEYSRIPAFERSKSRINVIQLYPGHLRPNDLYNKVSWELEAAELRADPYTCIIMDGIHNVFLQFPEIEKYQLFWPQIYSLLRSRGITTISTHSTLMLPSNGDTWGSSQVVDDARSEPLRHALIQKTDFQFEVDPLSVDTLSGTDIDTDGWLGSIEHFYVIRTASAIRQRIPRGGILWSRESLTLYEYPISPSSQPGEGESPTNAATAK